MLTKDFHPSQLTYVIESRRTAKYGNIATFILGISACVACVLPSHWSLKVSNLAIATGLFITSHKLEKLQKWGEDYRHANNHESIKGYAQHLNSSFAPPRKEIAIATPAELPAPVKFADVRKALSKPHLLVLGETNSGKSTLVKYLVSQASAPVIVLDSHAAPDDWQGMKVIGAGRNYKAIGEEVSRLVQLMDDRYKARDLGQKVFEPLLVILDEFPACVANLGKGFTDAIMLLVREARKVGIRLVILSQGSEVKALGIEGQGSIRECFAILSLGKFAIAAAKALKDDEIIKTILAAVYPAMLDDLPCALPKIDAVTFNNYPLPKDYLLLTGIDKLTEIDELTRIDSPIDGLKSLKSDVNPSTVNLSKKPAQVILDYARKQDKFVTASQVKAGARLFRDSSVLEIRRYFQWLADENLGVVRGDLENLEFSAS